MNVTDIFAYLDKNAINTVPEEINNNSKTAITYKNVIQKVQRIEHSMKIILFFPCKEPCPQTQEFFARIDRRSPSHEMVLRLIIGIINKSFVKFILWFFHSMTLSSH